MAETKVAVWDRWERDYGDKGPRWASRQGPGWFGGLNVWPYTKGAGAGCIGPRPGLQRYTLTSAPDGDIGALGYYIDNVSESVQFSVGTDLYLFNPSTMGGQAVTTATGSFEEPPTESSWGGNVAPRTYWTVRGDKSYQYNTSTNELDALGDAPGGRVMARHQDRFFVGDTGGGEEDRVYYSEPADFENWPALNFFEVDYDSNVTWLHSGSNRLMIQKGTSLWALTGSPGTTAQLRRLMRPGAGVRAGEGRVVADGDEYVFVANAGGHPGWTNGAIWDYDSQEQHPLADPKLAYSGNEPCVVALDADHSVMMLRRDNIWTRHLLGVAVSPRVTPARQRFVIGHHGSPVDFYVLDTTLHAPFSTHNDVYGSVGDASSTALEPCYVHLPEYWSDRGRQLTVREVKVDFVKWDTGMAQTNHFDVSVEAMALYETQGANASATLSFDEDGAVASSKEGTEDHRVFGFGDQGSGVGFQVRFDNLRGVGIRRVIVTFTEQEPRTR